MFTPHQTMMYFSSAKFPRIFKALSYLKNFTFILKGSEKYKAKHYRRYGAGFRLLKTAIFLFPTILIIVWPLNVHAQEPVFDPEYILSDYDLTNHQTMTINEIQNFLEEKGGALANYSTVDIDGKMKTAAEIIYRASQEYEINPQHLLTILQREKSLITKKSPSNDDYNWATGFSAYDYRSPVPRFRGFARQVDRAAWRFRYYLKHPWQFRFRVGIIGNTLVDWKDRWLVNIHGRYITAKNAATAGLYNYAPHVYDNWLFWTIWQNWFGDENQKFTDGTLLRIKNEQGVWLIQNSQRRPFYSENVFLLSYRFKDVKIVEKDDLIDYPIGSAMIFPNYSLVQSSLGEMFMLVGNKKRPISEKIFKNIGFHPDEIIKVNENDLNVYEQGTSILSPYPNGALLQDNETKAVYYVKENVKYPIIDISILNANFPYSHVSKVDPQELAEFAMGDQVKFRDGTLIKTFDSTSVYVISQQKRLPIPSAEVFETIGYQWNSIIEVDKSFLNMHDLGKILKLD